MKTDCAHSPTYDKQTGGSKCKKCGVQLNDYNQEPVFRIKSAEKEDSARINETIKSEVTAIDVLEMHSGLEKETISKCYSWVLSAMNEFASRELLEYQRGESGERVILNMVDQMCIQSLPPDYFERWEQIKELLISTRKIS